MILQRLTKLKGRSIAELRERLGQALAAELEHRGFASTVGVPSDHALRALLDPAHIGEGRDAKGVRAHFASRSSPPFFAGVRDGASAAALRTARWSRERTQLIATADQILKGKFDLLGYVGLDFGHPINWHVDPISARRAPMWHWSRIPYLNANLVGDHKVVWEINRHQHFFVLGRAFQVTGRPEYAECFTRNLASWMDSNPPKYGVNWASSLEISYRAIAWLWALELFRESPELTADLLQRALKYLYLHGRHLERYLSTYFSPNTHLTGEALGLLYLGTMLPELRRSTAWRTLGWKILEDELPKQVYEDGVYFEQATYYHRYTVDIYLHALLLAKANGATLPPAFSERLAMAVSHLADLTRPDGTIPIIGDDDGGRLVALEQRGFMDVRAPLATAAVALARPEFATVGGAVTEEALWLLGPDGVAAAESALAAGPPDHLSIVAPTGGYAIMRDGWDANASHAVMDVGPLGARNCGHAHSDALSVELSVGGCPVLVDPGTFTYTSSAEDRDWFRHSASHNTITVDGQSSSESAGPFSWRLRADARLESWWVGKLTDRSVGSHGGFRRLSDPAVHRRELIFAKSEYWLIHDSILATGSHETVAHFHLDPRANVTPSNPSAAWIEVPCATGSLRLFFAVLGDVTTLEWGESWASHAYGARQRAPYCRLVSKGTGRRDLITIIIPLRDGGDASVTEIHANQGRGVRVDRHGKHDLVLFRTAENGVVEAEQAELNADAALVRRSSPTGEVQAMALFGRDARLSVDGTVFTASVAGEAWREGHAWLVNGDGRIVSS